MRRQTRYDGRIRAKTGMSDSVESAAVDTNQLCSEPEATRRRSWSVTPLSLLKSSSLLLDSLCSCFTVRDRYFLSLRNPSDIMLLRSCSICSFRHSCSSLPSSWIYMSIKIVLYCIMLCYVIRRKEKKHRQKQGGKEINTKGKKRSERETNRERAGIEQWLGKKEKTQ